MAAVARRRASLHVQVLAYEFLSIANFPVVRGFMKVMQLPMLFLALKILCMDVSRCKMAAWTARPGRVLWKIVRPSITHSKKNILAKLLLTMTWDIMDLKLMLMLVVLCAGKR